MDLTTLISVLHDAVPTARLQPGAAFDQPTISVHRDDLTAIGLALRDTVSLGFSFLADVTAADFLPREPRFEVVYHLACLGPAGPPAGRGAAPKRLRLKVPLAGADAHLPTVSAIWPSAGWAEREVWDMFGIVFDGHPDLRRVLMPDDWEGHPLRKDYPVQIDLPTKTYAPLQLTEREFLAGVTAARHAAADVPAGGTRVGTTAARQPPGEGE